MTADTFKQLANTENLNIADIMAIERTALANERTLLSYIRTMIGLIAVGGTLIKFFEGFLMTFTGWAFVLAGGIMLIIGFTRYLKMHVLIHNIQSPHGQLSLEEDKLQYLFWLTLQKLHLASIHTP